MATKIYATPYSDLVVWGGKRVGAMVFKMGRFITEDPAKQKAIEEGEFFKKGKIILYDETKEQVVRDGGVDKKEKVPPEGVQCELCGAEFDTKKQLNGHMTSCRKKHEKGDEPPTE